MRFEYFQMIDRIAALDVGGRTVRSVCIVPKESTIFEGHFPSYPLMPGVLQIECMAQTCGWLVTAMNGFTAMPFLIGVKEAKFRTPSFPATSSNSKARWSTRAQASPSANARDARAGKAVCEAQITYRVMPFPNPEFRTGADGMGGAHRASGEGARQGEGDEAADQGASK